MLRQGLQTFNFSCAARLDLSLLIFFLPPFSVHMSLHLPFLIARDVFLPPPPLCPHSLAWFPKFSGFHPVSQILCTIVFIIVTTTTGSAFVCVYVFKFPFRTTKGEWQFLRGIRHFLPISFTPLSGSLLQTAPSLLHLETRTRTQRIRQITQTLSQNPFCEHTLNKEQQMPCGCIGKIFTQCKSNRNPSP